MDRTISRAGLLATFGALTAAAVISAPNADAAPNRSAYIKALDVNGVTYQTEQIAVEFGELACTKMTSSIPPRNVLAQFVYAGVTEFDASIIVVAAAKFLCPENEAKLPPAKPSAPKGGVAA